MSTSNRRHRHRELRQQQQFIPAGQVDVGDIVEVRAVDPAILGRDAFEIVTASEVRCCYAANDGLTGRWMGCLVSAMKRRHGV